MLLIWPYMHGTKWRPAAGSSVVQCSATEYRPLSSSESAWPFLLKRRQYPIWVCFAMTMNKSQGQSLKKVGQYLAKQGFMHGQICGYLKSHTKRWTMVNSRWWRNQQGWYDQEYNVHRFFLKGKVKMLNYWHQFKVSSFILLVLAKLDVYEDKLGLLIICVFGFYYHLVGMYGMGCLKGSRQKN